MAFRVYTQILERVLSEFESKTALIIQRGDRLLEWSYLQFYISMKQLTSSLVLAGITNDDYIIVIGSNTPEWVIAWHSAFFAAKCVVPVDPNLPTDEIIEILSRTQASAVFCDSSYLPLFEQLKSEHLYLRTIVSLTGPISLSTDHVEWSDFLALGDPSYNIFARQFEPDDSIAILFTSGTTGRSKGVVLTQKNYCSTAEYAVAMMGVTESDRVMAVLPLYHVFGFAATIAGALMKGVDVVFIPEIRGPQITSAMKNLQISALPAVPQMLTLILEGIKRGISEKGTIFNTLFTSMLALSYRLRPIIGPKNQRKIFAAIHKKFGGNFKLIISGGASLDVRSFKFYQALGFDIVEGYGLTETFGPITLCPRERPIQGSVGKIIGLNEMKIETPDVDGWGEVLFKGDSVFAGYLDDPDTTASVFTADGWFRTGDRGRIDNEGYLYLSGRLKDVIVLDSGKNVYPEELEHYYESSESIDEVAVFGIQEKNRTVVAAIVVPKSVGRSGSEVELHSIHSEMNRLGQGRPDYKRIGMFVISDHPLPRTSTKKIKKHLLPSLYKKLIAGIAIASPVPMTAIQAVFMESERYKSICKAVKELAPIALGFSDLTPNLELLKDLGLDSLRMLDLVAMIEAQLGIAVDPKELVNLLTLEDLVNLVNSSGGSNHTKSIGEILREYCLQEPCTFKDQKGFVATVGLAMLVVLSKLLWGFRVRGVASIPTDRPVIFAANHQSLLDGLWLYAVLPPKIRKRTYAMIKVELTKAFFVKQLQSGVNVIPVEREGDIITPLQKSYSAISAGKNIVIFPEGTRSVDGAIHEFRAGVGILMRETNAVVVPIRLVNADKKWPKGKAVQIASGWKNRPELIFGDPISLDSIGMNRESDEKAIAEKIRLKLLEIQ